MMVTVTTIYVQRDGPYIATGDFALDAGGAPRDNSSVMLCRCGRSSNKPYCDGTHTHVGFVDAGVLPANDEPNDLTPSGRLMIAPTPNGPLKCVGQLTVSGAEGRIRECRDICLCRCGGSGTKPFCDGTHKKIGFIG
jgi:CDGSH-type Zn-finger protein